MVLFNKITGQKRKKGMSRHVLSFQQSLSFVERFKQKNNHTELSLQQKKQITES